MRWGWNNSVHWFIINIYANFANFTESNVRYEYFSIDFHLVLHSVSFICCKTKMVLANANMSETTLYFVNTKNVLIPCNFRIASLVGFSHTICATHIAKLSPYSRLIISLQSGQI